MPLERVIDYVEGKDEAQTSELNKILPVTIEEGMEIASEFKLDSCPFMHNQVNINYDMSVPVCCTVFDQTNTIVQKNYLESSLSEINAGKEKVKICTKCMDYDLPAYNMGFNRKKWDEIALQKTSTDI